MKQWMAILKFSICSVHHISIIIRRWAIVLYFTLALILAGQQTFGYNISVHPDDSLALVAFYHSTNGDEWNDNSGWLIDPVKFWVGVDGIQNVGTEENPDWRVTRITMLPNNMTVAGVIPQEISKLTYLQRFISRHNKLSGPIPAGIGNLEYLQRFDVCYNQFSDEIPWETFSGMPSLALLDLAGNDFTGEISPQIVEFNSLIRLDIAGNNLSGEIPPEIIQVTTLERLIATGNAFTGPFPDLSPLSELQHLRLNGDFDPGPIPEWIQDMFELEVLDIQGANRVGVIPEWFDSMVNLRSLYLGDDHLAGSLPNLGASLQVLSLRNISLTGDLNEWLSIHHFTLLRQLEIINVPLTGTIPEQIFTHDLQYLILNGSDVGGTIPASLGDHSSLLRELDLGNNQLEGQIPEELGQLQFLEILHVNNNRNLFGPIPLTFKNLHNLNSFRLAETGVYVPHDEELQNWLEGIEHLELSDRIVPPQVATISPVQNLIITGTSIEAAWDEAGEFYHVELAADSEFTSIVMDTTVNENSIEFTGLENQQQYWWRVRAQSMEETGPFSEVKTFYVTHDYVQTGGKIVSGVSRFTDDLYFTSSKDDRVYCFNREGKILWMVETGGELLSTVSVDPDGNIFVGSTDTRLYSYDKNGIPRWNRDLGGRVLSSPAIGSNKVVYTGISTGRFFGISQEDGEILWWIQAGDAIHSSASINMDENVYFGSDDGKLYAVTGEGELLWTYQTGGAIVSSPALTRDGAVVITSMDGNLYKMDHAGDLLWKYDTESFIQTSPVINSDGVIYFGSGDGIIHAVNRDGQPLWDYDTGSSVTGSPALSDIGMVIFGNQTGQLLVFSPDGVLQRSLKSDGEIAAPILINPDDEIFLSDSNGKVSVLKNLIPEKFSKNRFVSDVPIPEWATFKGNNRRTGNQNDIFVVSAENFIEESENIPSQFTLHQNYPNPFNPSTQIRFAIPEQAHVNLTVYDLLGQRVATLVNESRSPGWHDVTFDASRMSSGTFIYRLEAGDYVETRSMMFVK